MQQCCFHGVLLQLYRLNRDVLLFCVNLFYCINIIKQLLVQLLHPQTFFVVKLPDSPAVVLYSLPST